MDNLGSLPSWLPQFTAETVEEGQARRERNSNTAAAHCVLEPTLQCDISELQQELADAGYLLIRANWRQRQNRKEGGKPYYMVRFVFSDEAERGQADAQTILAFEWMVASRYWRVRASDNGTGGPFSLNCELQVWRLDKYGAPLLQRKNGKGTRRPVPAQHRLHVTESLELKVAPVA